MNAIGIVDDHTHAAVQQGASFNADAFRSEVSAVLEKLWRGTSNLRQGEVHALIEVFRDLYGFQHTDLTPENAGELMELMVEKKTDGFPKFYVTAMDIAGVEFALVNLPRELHPDLDRRRFKWVPFLDPLLLPLSTVNERFRAINPPLFELFLEPGLEVLRREHIGEEADLDAYVKHAERVVYNLKGRGACALKVISTFFRPIRFDPDVDWSEAGKVYDIYRRGGVVGMADYIRLQDFLMKQLTSLCGRINLPIQIHTGLAMESLTLHNSSPVNLEALLACEGCADTRIVLLHGAYPFADEAGEMALQRKNLYLDFSWLAGQIPTKFLSHILEKWIGWKLDEGKLLFGTDAALRYAPDDVGIVYEARRGRRGISRALNGMIEDGTLEKVEALEVAERVLRENGMNLYNL